MVRVTVLVSGGGVNLQAILDACCFGEIPDMELAGVISSVAGAYALERAQSAHVATYVVERALFPNNASFCSALLDKLRDLDTQLVVTAGFTEKLNYPLLHFYRGRVINVQPALFPAFCTASGFDEGYALEQSIRLGVRISGATAYFMTEEDNGVGPIIVQRAVELPSDEGAEALSERIMRQGEWPVLTQAIRLYCAGKLALEGARVQIKDGPG